jgi:hypothetical protein
MSESVRHARPQAQTHAFHRRSVFVHTPVVHRLHATGIDGASDREQLASRGGDTTRLQSVYRERVTSDE